MPAPRCDNPSFVVVNKDLALSLALAFSDPRGEKRATHYVKSESRLIFATGPFEDGTPLLVPMGHQDVLPLVERWLTQEAVYPEQTGWDEADHIKGWRVSCDQWGTTYGLGDGAPRSGFVAIEPFWALSGK